MRQLLPGMISEQTETDHQCLCLIACSSRASSPAHPLPDMPPGRRGCPAAAYEMRVVNTSNIRAIRMQFAAGETAPLLDQTEEAQHTRLQVLYDSMHCGKT